MCFLISRKFSYIICFKGSIFSLRLFLEILHLCVCCITWGIRNVVHFKSLCAERGSESISLLEF